MSMAPKRKTAPAKRKKTPAKRKRTPAKRKKAPTKRRQARAGLKFEDFEESLQELASPQPNEDMVRRLLANLFDDMGHPTYIELPIAGGATDLHVSDCNLIVECKKSGKAGPNNPGSPRKKQQKITQKEQLFNYVNDMRSQVRDQTNLMGMTDDQARLWVGRPWVGVLTDGKSWWVWQWTPGEGEPKKPFLEFDSAETPELAFRHIVSLLDDEERKGLRWLPEKNLSTIFSGREGKLTRIYNTASGQRGTQTKFEVWLDMLKASGIVPDSTAKQNLLFVKHSYLVAIAKAVVAALSDAPASTEAMEETLSDGFTSWIFEAEGGEEWAIAIFKKAREYDWRMNTRDVLRRFYQDVIAKEDRQAYGEYYTPDWLAEMLAERILDEAWIERSVQASLDFIDGRRENLDGIGVLDPTCGSGTFLFHAARRLLKAKALEGRKSWERTNSVMQLVHGIDIHPVAVEMARATLLRALPTMPEDGSRRMSISQGDSLQIGKIEMLKEVFIPDTDDPYFRLSLELILDAKFSNCIDSLVASANRQDEEIPPRLLEGMESHVDEMEKIHSEIRRICREKGNGVWGWLIRNTIAPLRLAKKKVDRILANPPWVRMSNIKVEERSAAMREMARLEELDIWVGGKQATGFDIAALFIMRCRQLYLVTGATRMSAAWVTNRASISADSWEKFRQKFAQSVTKVLNFSELKKAPFTGAASCAWIEGVAAVADEQPGHYLLRNASDGGSVRMVRREDDWKDVKEKTRLDPARPPLPAKPSGYVSLRGKAVFRNGATLYPDGLVKVEDRTPAGRERMKVKTKPSSKAPWKGKSVVKDAAVPAHWIVPVVTSKDLLPFCLRDPASHCVIPLTREGMLEENPEREDYWKQASKIYARHCGQGATTPKTLLENLNYNGKLSKQLPLAGDEPVRVIYNKSGQYLRSARCRSDAATENTCYWHIARNEREAGYLVALLNASSLQDAYKAARKSDRDFHTHFWFKVPIPYYNDDNADHRRLAELCKVAEGIASATQANCDPGLGQEVMSNALRDAITVKADVMAEIDQIAAKLLPDHAMLEEG